MHTSILGKVHVVASKYDPETRAKAVRLVLEHRDDYPSEWAAITAVSKRLGMTAETLRNWIRQQQVDEGECDGVSSEAAAEIRALKRRNAELEQTIEILKAATLSSCGRATRATAADRSGLRVHRREQGPLRGRSDLPRADRARGADRPANVSTPGPVRAPSKRALWDATITEILAGYYEPDEHGRRKPESLYGSLKMWAHLQREGIPVAKSTVERLMRRNGWQGVRRARRSAPRSPIRPRCGHRIWWTASSASRPQRAARGRLHLRQARHRGVRLRRVRHRRLRRSDRRLGASASKHTRFVESAIRQAAALRARQGHPIEDAIHHSRRRIAVHEREIR